MSQEPTGISRVRIIGKQATNAEVAKYIASELSNPNMTKRKLAAALGTSRPTIDAYCKMAASLKIEIEASKETKISKIEETQPEFLANPYVKTWNDYMDAKTNFESKNQFLQNMYQICKTLRCPPQYFILGDSIADVLAQGRKLMTAFMQEYSKGTALVIYRKDPAQSNKQQAAYRFSKVARDFMKSHGYQYPTGEKGVMSQSVAPFHGKYSDIRIVEETHQNIKRELAEEHGAQSDEWLAYMFGMESFGREGAIFSAPTHHTMIESKGRAIMVLKVYESKTKHYHNGLWTKHLFDAELQTEIKRRAATRPGKLFYVSRNRIGEIAQTLKRKYAEHGLTAQGQLVHGDADTSYFLRKPYHVLRHAGAQRTLRATRWNVAYVAARGWKKTQELIDSYGEMPADIEMDIVGDVAF